MKKKLLIFFLLTLFFFSAQVALGAIVPDGGKKDSGNYNLNDFVQLGVNISQWILGIVGSLALLMFVYGGITFVFSGGSSQTVEKGKKIITSALIGLVIVFTSWTIIRFSMLALGLEWQGTTEKPEVIKIQSSDTPAGSSVQNDSKCEALATDGYSCMANMNNTTGYDCKTGYCTGPTNRKCCKKLK